jgi:hypothetical protein
MKHLGTIDIYLDEDDDQIVLKLSSDRNPDYDGLEGFGDDLVEALESLMEEVYAYSD